MKEKYWKEEHREQWHYSSAKFYIYTKRLIIIYSVKEMTYM